MRQRIRPTPTPTAQCADTTEQAQAVRQRVSLAAPQPPPAAAPTDPGPAQPPGRKKARGGAKTDPPAVEDEGYQIGYRNPPKHSQFKPGPDPRRPKGRKPGSRNKANSIVEMMESPTMVRTPQGAVRSISTAEAMARKLRELCLSGQLPAISKAFELYHKAQPPAVPTANSNDQASAETAIELLAADQAIIAWFAAEVRAQDKKAPGT
ncbi:MAG: DUF5681 domain-containing protein [Novosphingobium sp.]|nr:DUF5681 domain-containing protein [Novosphingobium sp.]